MSTGWLFSVLLCILEGDKNIAVGKSPPGGHFQCVHPRLHLIQMLFDKVAQAWHVGLSVSE